MTGNPGFTEAFMKRWKYGFIPILGLAVIAALIYAGIIQLNRPSEEAYPVRGVDVSHYQGNIDWNKLEAQGVMFAFIKATEGSSHTDSMFQANWKNVAQTELRAGAYHFFSFESSGQTQAENFINTVSFIDNMLPPVVDVEPYGKYKSVKDNPAVISEMQDWLDAVEAEYGMKPVIYTTEAYYNDFIAAEFQDYDIWIRSVYKQPSDSVQWTFWQYSNRMRLDGYDGEERFIDMNAFNASVESFQAYGHGSF